MNWRFLCGFVIEGQNGADQKQALKLCGWEGVVDAQEVQRPNFAHC